MYPLHSMDRRYIFNTIDKAKDEVMDFDDDKLVFRLENEIDLTDFQKDFLSMLIKHNDELSPQYKELLIHEIKKGGE